MTADLDLAFAAEGAFTPELLQAAGPWADPVDGTEHWHGLLEQWLSQLADELPAELKAPAYSLGLSLVGDDEIAALNANWRDQRGPTDVLAFAAQDAHLDGAPPMPLPPGQTDDENGDGVDKTADAEPLELGDIVISLDTAARQADDHGHTLEHELQFLASHGLLHLLGWTHPDEESLATMLNRQSLLLKSSTRQTG